MQIITTLIRLHIRLAVSLLVLIAALLFVCHLAVSQLFEDAVWNKLKGFRYFRDMILSSFLMQKHFGLPAHTSIANQNRCEYEDCEDVSNLVLKKNSDCDSILCFFRHCYEKTRKKNYLINAFDCKH